MTTGTLPQALRQYATRVRDNNNRLADTIRRHWPLPRREAESLAAAVRRLETVSLSPMSNTPVSVDSAGHFVVTLNILFPMTVAPQIPGGVEQALRQRFVSAGWRVSIRNQTVALTSRQAFPALAGAPALSADDLALLGLGAAPSDPVVRRCCAGLAAAIRRRDRRSAEQILGEIADADPSDVRLIAEAAGNGVMSDASPARPRPSFQAVWNSFYKQNLQPNFKLPIANIIGGYVLLNARIPGSRGFHNFCTIRISYALNQAGFKIPYISDDQTSSGAKHNWYLHRVADLTAYLRRIWGPPEVYSRRKAGKLDLARLKGKQGILVLHVDVWGDATGHATLWNGRETKDHSEHYFAKSFAVSLWVLP